MVRRLLLLLALLTASAWGQEAPRIAVAVQPHQVRLGEAAALSVVVEASERPPQPRIPVSDEYVLIPVSYSESQTNVNGVASYQALYGFELRPSRVGEVDIAPFEVEMGGVTYRSEPLRVTVTGEAPAPEAGPTGPPVLVTAEVDRREVWVGQAVLWRFQFLRSVNLLASPEYRPPSTPGFLTVQRPQREVSDWRDGREYAGAEVRLLLFPQTSGTAKVGAASARISRGAFNPYDLAEHRDFFQRLFGAGQGMLVTPAFEIRVKPLPTRGRPAEFRGAVGDFQITASLDRQETRVGEPVTLEVRISGEGNLGLLDPPALPALPAFRVHETRSEGGLDPDGDRPTGTRTFTTVLEPRAPGEHRLAGMRFAWFDPEAGVYRTTTLPDLKVRVTGTALPNPSPSPVGAVKTGLREPRLPPSLWPAVPPQGPWVLVTPLLALVLVLAWPAPRPRVLRGVAAARASLEAGAAPSAVLGAWLEERLGPQARALSRGDLRTRLGLSAESWQALSRLLDDLDAVRFAPAAEAGREEARHGPAVLALVERLEGERR